MDIGRDSRLLEAKPVVAAPVPPSLAARDAEAPPKLFGERLATEVLRRGARSLGHARSRLRVRTKTLRAVASDSLAIGSATVVHNKSSLNVFDLAA